jgi:hypothetical protein
MNHTLLDECFRVQGRTKWYTAPDEIQRDLDTFMALHNFRRTHQGYRVAGRTPAKALYDLIAQRWLLPPMSDPAREVPLAADLPSPQKTGCRGNTRLVHADGSGSVQSCGGESKMRSVPLRLIRCLLPHPDPSNARASSGGSDRAPRRSWDGL